MGKRPAGIPNRVRGRFRPASLVRRVSYLWMLLLLVPGLDAQTYVDAAITNRSRAVEVGLLGSGAELKTNLGMSLRYYPDQREAGGFVHVLVGFPLFDSDRFDFLIGPQVGVLPRGKAAGGIRMELSTNRQSGFRFGLAAEQDFVDRPTSALPAEAMAFIGWVY